MKYLVVTDSKNCHNCPKNIVLYYNAVMQLKDADEVANREGPDQTAP